jgi:hypothetical protein
MTTEAFTDERFYDFCWLFLQLHDRPSWADAQQFAINAGYQGETSCRVFEAALLTERVPVLSWLASDAPATSGSGRGGG